MEDSKLKDKRFRRGPDSPSWKGGHRIRPSGYMHIWMPEYHRLSERNYVLEHIYVMEKHLGRWLTSGEVVHHKNGNKQDNRIENLELMTISQHIAIHRKIDHTNTLCLWCDKKGETNTWVHHDRGYLCKQCADRFYYYSVSTQSNSS